MESFQSSFILKAFVALWDLNFGSGSDTELGNIVNKYIETHEMDSIQTKFPSIRLNFAFKWGLNWSAY